nr:hypothetical protein CFP56_09302 [Quercus suber]
MPAGVDRGGAVEPTLPSLPIEILLRIVKASLPAGDEKSQIDILGAAPSFPTRFAVTRINRAFCQSILRWAYGINTFTFISQLDELYFDSNIPQYAGGALLTWLRKIGPINRRSIRRLELALTTSELLILCATAESKVLLNLPRNLHAWAECLAMLKGLALNSLHITILSEACHKSTGHDYLSKHFEPDHHWAVKAVVNAFGHLPTGSFQFTTDRWGPIDQVEVQLTLTKSWNLLHSDTFAYLRSNKLAYPDGRSTTWASTTDEPIKAYRIPVRLVAGMREEGIDGFVPFLDGLALLCQ